MILKIDKAPVGKAAQVAKIIVSEQPSMATVKRNSIWLKFDNGKKKKVDL